MTTKVLTVRVPSPMYSSLCEEAAELGVPVASHVRRLIEREHEAQQLEQMRAEILGKLVEMTALAAATASMPALDEILLLVRAIAAHANPQLVAQVKAKLAKPTGAPQ